MMFAQAMEFEEPSIRNSNLFPVKAKGEVRLRSVESRRKRGRASAPRRSQLRSEAGQGSPRSRKSRMPLSSEPR